MNTAENLQVKACTKCKIEKVLSEYGPKKGTSTGTQSTCKACDAAYARARYPLVREKRRVQAKLWNKNNQARRRENLRRYCSENRDKILDYARKIPQSVKRERVKRYYEKNPLAYKAHNLVNEAKKAGRLVPGPCACENGRCRGAINAHHDDYSKPLKVTWLCKNHHEAWHRIFIPEQISPPAKVSLNEKEK